MSKMQKLNGFVKIECIDHTYVYGLNVAGAIQIVTGCTAKQLSDFAQSKFGFGINFTDEATYAEIQQDVYNATDRVYIKFMQSGMDPKEAWSEALAVVQHMSFAKPAEQWTDVPA